MVLNECNGLVTTVGMRIGAAASLEPIIQPQWAYNRAAGGAMSELEKRVEERFGVLPNFFRLAPETPEIIEKLWGFAQAAYLDNPLPSVFKERLFVHLSRFCAVRYCIARHVGFLVGLGRPAGDPTVRTQSVTDVVKLLRRPLSPRTRTSVSSITVRSLPRTHC